jgi:hypothetical protein
MRRRTLLRLLAMTVPGMGGQQEPAINAPAGQATPVGVQPGVSSGIVNAHYVIVSGTGGGLFIYSGTPAAGNPPVIAATAANTDPFGNNVRPANAAPGAEVAVLGTGGTFVQMAVIGGTPFLVFGSGAASETQAALISPGTTGSGSSEQDTLAIQSGTFNSGATAEIELLSANASGSLPSEISLDAELLTFVATDDALTITAPNINLDSSGDLSVDGGLTVGDGVAASLVLSPKLGAPFNYPLNSGSTTFQVAQCVNTLIASLVNLGMIA